MKLRNYDVQDQSGGNGEGEEKTDAYVTAVEWTEMGVRDTLTFMFLTMTIGRKMVLFMDQGIREDRVEGKINVK